MEVMVEMGNVLIVLVRSDVPGCGAGEHADDAVRGVCQAVEQKYLLTVLGRSAVTVWRAC